MALGNSSSTLLFAATFVVALATCLHEGTVVPEEVDHQFWPLKQSWEVPLEDDVLVEVSSFEEEVGDATDPKITKGDISKIKGEISELKNKLNPTKTAAATKQATRPASRCVRPRRRSKGVHTAPCCLFTGMRML